MLSRCCQTWVNSIFLQSWRIACEEVVLHLTTCKCMPILLYGLEALPLNKSPLSSLDFLLTVSLSSSSSSVPISEPSRLHKLTPLWTILRTHPVLSPRLWGEGRALLYGAMSALVDLPGVVNPLEDDWWLLEECASGLVMGRLSQDVRTDEVVSLQ